MLFFATLDLTLFIQPANTMKLIQSMPIKVGLVDDHQLFRMLLAGYLSQQSEMKVIFEASNASELFSKLSCNTIDILLLDIFMPNMNGIDAATILRNEFPHIKIVIVSLCTDINIITTFLDTGIYAYLSKNEDPENVVSAIKAASENRIYKSSLFTEALYKSKESEIKNGIRKSDIILDQREKQIIQLIWEEKSNKEISEAVYLSVSSIEKIKQDLKDRLDVRSIAGLIRFGILNGVISLKRSNEIRAQIGKNTFF
jgi:DNA-binding NarL/FixJ family response regulator